MRLSAIRETSTRCTAGRLIDKKKKKKKNPKIYIEQNLELKLKLKLDSVWLGSTNAEPFIHDTKWKKEGALALALGFFPFYCFEMINAIG